MTSIASHPRVSGDRAALISASAEMTLHAELFDLESTMDSGQVFGFRKISAQCYEGGFGGQRTVFSQEGPVLRIRSEEPVDPAAVRRFFDLDRDLDPIHACLDADESLAGLSARFRGLRILKQDAWEATACFIISANNNVKRIQHIWRNLCQGYCGSLISFPTPEAIAASNAGVLRRMGLGYRAPYLFETAKAVAQNRASFEEIHTLDYASARGRVLEFKGVGDKVAECVLLYGFGKQEAFPVDVWIFRAIKKLYFRRRRLTPKKAREFGQKRWGASAGYVQQHLFHGARTGFFDII